MRVISVRRSARRSRIFRSSCGSRSGSASLVVPDDDVVAKEQRNGNNRETDPGPTKTVTPASLSHELHEAAALYQPLIADNTKIEIVPE